jgi:hypothetical protein
MYLKIADRMASGHDRPSNIASGARRQRRLETDPRRGASDDQRAMEFAVPFQGYLKRCWDLAGDGLLEV